MPAPTGIALLNNAYSGLCLSFLFPNNRERWSDLMPLLCHLSQHSLNQSQHPWQSCILPILPTLVPDTFMSDPIYLVFNIIRLRNDRLDQSEFNKVNELDLKRLQVFTCNLSRFEDRRIHLEELWGIFITAIHLLRMS